MSWAPDEDEYGNITKASMVCKSSRKKKKRMIIEDIKYDIINGVEKEIPKMG